MDEIIKTLIDGMKTLPVIDAHSHLAAQEEMLLTEPDVFTRIFCHYSLTSAVTSGLVTREHMRDTTVPLRQRFDEFKPCLTAIRDCGYVQAALRTAEEYYGVDDVNEDTIDLLQRRIQADCTPGQYERVFTFCNIEKVINQHTYAEPSRAVSVNRSFMMLGDIRRFKAELGDLVDGFRQAGEPVSSLEDLFETWFENELRQRPFVGVKLMSNFIYEETPSDADAQYRHSAALGHRHISDSQAGALCTWLRHRLIKECGCRNLPIAVHCGINWNTTTALSDSFYHNNPRNIMAWAVRYPDTTFDLYHAGIPWVRDIAVIANQCPNVVLNLVWACQIAPEMAAHFLGEWLDLVPINKIIGFGGDSTTPEKTVGALSLTRECVARALAERVASRKMNLTRALDICRAWMYDNPKRIYHL